MSSDKSPNWVIPLLIGLLAFGVLVCAGVIVVLAAGGAAAYLVSAPVGPQSLGGPVAIVASQRAAAPPSARRYDGPFVYATATESTEPLPARFQRPLPISPDEWDETIAGYIAERACASDPAMNAKVLAAVKAMVVTGFGDELPDTYGAIYQDCEDGHRPCAFLEGVVNGTEAAVVKEPFWLGLAYCDGPSVARAFERPDSSDAAYIDWVEYRETVTGTASPGWSKRFEEAAARVIRDGDKYQAHQTAITLGATDDPRVAGALVAIHAAERDPEKKKAVAFAMFRQSDPAARAIFDRACAAPDAEPVCRGEGFATPEPDLARGVLDDLVDDYEVDLAALQRANEKTRRPALVAALTRCAGEEDWRGRECLAALAAIEWKAASAIAGTRPAADDPWAGELHQALRLADRASWIARLKAEGMLRSGDTVDPAAIELRELLANAGRASSFDVETGMFPNQHDRLLYRLANLARPELEGIALLEFPPDEGSGEPYRLDAFLGGRHWRVDAEDLGDWYDLETCLGLLNTILEQRGSTTRFVSLDTGDQTTVVVAGPKEGIVRLATERFLDTGRPSKSAVQGKDFEKKVLEGLQ